MCEAPPHAVRCLKPDGLRSVWLVQRPGTGPRTLKGWPLTLGLLLKLALGIAQPQRQIRGTRLLRRAEIATPACAGSWRFARRGSRLLVELELEHAPGLSLHHLLADSCAVAGLPGAHREHLARTLGATVAKIAAARLFHRDMKLTNLIVDCADTPPSLAVIDAVGVRGSRRPVVERARMLRSLARSMEHEAVAGKVEPRLRIMAAREALRGLERRSRRTVMCLLRGGDEGRARP
jgi:tRNA A-37 threonylcarbamoyl transferase component Bud32